MPESWSHIENTPQMTRFSESVVFGYRSSTQEGIVCWRTDPKHTTWTQISTITPVSGRVNNQTRYLTFTYMWIYARIALPSSYKGWILNLPSQPMIARRMQLARCILLKRNDRALKKHWKGVLWDVFLGGWATIDSAFHACKVWEMDFWW